MSREEFAYLKPKLNLVELKIQETLFGTLQNADSYLEVPQI